MGFGLGFRVVDSEKVDSEDSFGFEQESNDELKEDKKLYNSCKNKKVMNLFSGKSFDIHEAGHSPYDQESNGT